MPKVSEAVAKLPDFGAMRGGKRTQQVDDGLIEFLRSKFKQRDVTITRPESEFPELIVDIPDSWPYFDLAPLYDVHIGAHGHDAAKFAKHVSWIERTKYVLTFNGGDMFDNASKLSVGEGVYSQDGSPQDQIKDSAGRVASIHHKMLFSLPGNHEDRSSIMGLDAGKTLAWLMDVPYFPDYCLAPETRVMTDTFDWVPIGNLQNGDGIIGFQEEPVHRARRSFERGVVEYIKRVNMPCYEIVLADGTEFVASADHMWLTQQGRNSSHFVWRRTEDLVAARRKDAVPPTIIRATKTWKRDSDRDSGLISAVFNGEGNIVQARSGKKQWKGFTAAFNQKPGMFLDEVKAALARKGIDFYEQSRRDGLKTIVVKGGSTAAMEFIGRMQPRRLRDNIDMGKLGRFESMEAVEVKRLTFIGEREVVSVRTSCRTFLAEGFASHNCMCLFRFAGQKFRLLAHHGTGAAQSPGGQRNAARKDTAWAACFDVLWTGHLHAPVADPLYRLDYVDDRVVVRNAIAVISPSYLNFFGTYAAKKRYPPGQTGLTLLRFNRDGRIDTSLYVHGVRA